MDWRRKFIYGNLIPKNGASWKLFVDEEREDFRARVKNTLESPDKPANPIDPVGWVTTRKYIEQDYNNVLQRFLLERDISVHGQRS